jgi:predicted AlkP superfamily phosphohydrolase/phosphomutase
MRKSKRGVIIGLDGVPYGLLDDLSDRSTMPGFKELKKEGAFVPMKSTIPANSAVSWSTIITGENPGGHGVYGFTDLMRNSYINSYHSFLNLTAPPFWIIENTRRYLIMINGALLSGFVSPDQDRAVFPPSYSRKLREIGYQIDVDASKAKKSKMMFLKELNDVLDRRIDALNLLSSKIDWDILMFIVTGTDRLEHYLWDAYQNKSHEWHKDFLDFYSKVDEAISHITSMVDEETPLLMLSDHGMEGVDEAVNINTHLAQQGFLDLEDNPRKSYNGIKRGTTAFALESARVYLNKVDRFPRGSVQKDKELEMMNRVSDSLLELKRGGRKVIKDVHRREDIYRGSEIERAPDLVLVPESGFSLKTGLLKDDVFEKDFLTGKHTEDDAFLFARGWPADEDFPQDPSVEDILSIFWNMIGVR